MVINIDVKNKIAVPDGSIIVCGNSDYQIKFTFDEEWDGLTYKTARFVFKKDGQMQYIDAVFSGDTVDVPILSNIRYVHVGVYTDALQTTAPAQIACELSIRCNSGENVDPYTPEDRDKLIEIFNEVVQEQEVAKAAAEEAQEAAELAQEIVGNVVSRVKEKNGRYVTFWVGTQEEYNALGSEEPNCMYIITDDATGDDIKKAMGIESEEYSGCYYRLKDVGAEQAKVWINPPMMAHREPWGEIYNTTECYRGDTVKVYSLERTLTDEAEDTLAFTYGPVGMQKVISLTGVAEKVDIGSFYPIPYYRSENDYCVFEIYDRKLYVNHSPNFKSYNVRLIIKYV